MPIREITRNSKTHTNDFAFLSLCAFVDRLLTKFNHRSKEKAGKA